MTLVLIDLQPDAEKTFPDVEAYFQQVLQPWLAQRPDEGDRAVFLRHELDEWERIERKLEEWARDNAKREERGEGALDNPYSPALDVFQVATLIASLKDPHARKTYH